MAVLPVPVKRPKPHRTLKAQKLLLGQHLPCSLFLPREQHARCPCLRVGVSSLPEAPNPSPPPNRSIPSSEAGPGEKRATAASSRPLSIHHAQGRGQAPLVRSLLAPRHRRRRHPGPSRRHATRPRRRRHARPQGAFRHRLSLLRRRQRYVLRSLFSSSLRSALPLIDG